MTRQHDGRTLTRATLALCLLAGAAASFVLIEGVAPLPASAEASRMARGPHDGDGDDGRVGNGTRNNNLVTVRSPTSNQGYQHTSSDTMGGATGIQNALCKHAKVCNINLQVIIINPGKGKKKAASKKAKTSTSAQTDTAGQKASDECDCDCDSAC
ncbi:hypothetical protein [Sphaerisporangium perillae]|uniref:hypothetical protein n=1 Tax=Sphaerisporangium perillae TaxID=2935860 RepID=UPI00200D1968|nr:hypothetical protein [Sphaerisporangium perillae]